MVRNGREKAWNGGEPIVAVGLELRGVEGRGHTTVGHVEGWGSYMFHYCRPHSLSPESNHLPARPFSLCNLCGSRCFVWCVRSKVIVGRTMMSV